MRSKVLFIYLDGTDRDLLLEWGREGLLPNLQSIIAIKFKNKSELIILS